AEIEINSSIKTGKFSSHLSTDNTSGNFNTRLPLNDEYEIIVKVPKFPQQVLTVSTLQVDSSGALNVYADFTSPDYDKKLEELKISVEEKLKAYRRNFDPKQFQSVYGNARTDMLVFEVQVAAYKFYENFNYNNVKGFPKIIRHTDPDQITRFTMGNYSTYNEAKKLLEKIRKDNLKDAFIIAVYKGEKKQLLQLVQENILK
ncbi:MAG: hypothetical protein JNL60_13120, partial [Bacteroidia bacterium]|nr:hypothetical protein [Bacteroidia bacterium]